MPIQTYRDFWDWFMVHEEDFFQVVKESNDIERDFFDKLSEKLDQLKDGYWFLAGMYDNDTAELILTADGNLKDIVFVEELIKAAPILSNWKFTALKPPLDMQDVAIDMKGLKFQRNNLFFYSNDDPRYPDEIDITIVYSDYRKEIEESIVAGTYLFLDNFLGELNFVTSIDNMQIIGKESAEKDLIPIEKLKDFLTWRQKEFIERYEGIRHDTENDSYKSLEATLKSGKPLLAVVNATLLDWDRKASHPWILIIEIKYEGNKSGMPDKATYDMMNVFEDRVMDELKDSEGYLNIGRETADSLRTIYFACKDFRLPSKVLFQLQSDYQGKLNLDYDIFKDKYWRAFDRFKPTVV